MNHSISQAFILGAGLGTRLRPLTTRLPKPLVPVWNKPLITYAMDHLIADLGVKSFMINTHHCPESYPETFPSGDYRDCPIALEHEPVLLDTAGGIDNIRDWLPEKESFIVYNGDILTDLSLAPALEAHQAGANLVTLILRRGDKGNVSYDENSGLVTDLRGITGNVGTGTFQFTGIYLVAP
ncbi:MAG: sugar phosphate nucleotidyltransferase, partial [Verrucomicrobiota bacterium]